MNFTYILLSILPCLPALQEDDSNDRLELMDVFELEQVNDPQIAPDGKQVVFVRRSMDVMRDRVRSRLWISQVENGSMRPLGSDESGANSPRWSPSGDRLAYGSVSNGSSQIYLRYMDTGESVELSHLPKSPSELSWSPDGKWLAFSMQVAAESKPLANLPSAPKGAKWAKAPRVIESISYRSDGAGFLEQGHRQLFVLPIEGGTPRQLSTGEFDVSGPFSWSPDGSKILLSSNRTPIPELHPNRSELWELTVRDGSLKQLTERSGPDESASYSPDGKLIAYTGFDDKRLGFQARHLYLMNSDGSQGRLLIGDKDLDVSHPTWSRSGEGLFFSHDQRGVTHLSFVNLKGERELLETQIGGLSLGRPYSGGQFSVAQDDSFAFTLTGSDHPADLAVGRRGRSGTKRLTALNDDLLASKTLGKVEELRWESSYDQREIQGWVIKPPHFDATQSYPMILEIHGGPFAAYGPHFSMECQLYAAAGYIVLYCNPRGSTSYGHEFANLIHHNYPSQDYDDLISGVDALIEEGNIKRDELYVTGGSGGGLLSAWIVGKTDRFRAAVVAKPVINWTSFALTADAYPFFTQYWFDGMPWENQEAYWKRSPLSLVGNVKTPTMLLTGEQDHRTPISESEQFYQALKLRQVDAAMVRIPEASHGIASRPSQLVAKVAYILAWFERYSPAAE